MASRLVNVVFDCARPRTVAEFWSALLDWEIAVDLTDEVDVRAPASNGWDLDLTFVPVPEPKRVKNRLHLELASSSTEHQKSLVDKALSLGARESDIGQGDVPWRVLADVEGNEFCVLEPRPEYRDTGALAAIAVDAPDAAVLGRFWSSVLDWPVEVLPIGLARLRSRTGTGPWLEFLTSQDPKLVKNRVHLDVAPLPGVALADEVDRLRALGATPADVGQRDVPWVTLTDPGEHELCVLALGGQSS